MEHLHDMMRWCQVIRQVEWDKELQLLILHYPVHHHTHNKDRIFPASCVPLLLQPTGLRGSEESGVV